MNGNRKSMAIGLVFLIAGLIGCEDSPTSPNAFGQTSYPSVVAVLVQNATAFDIDVSAELGRGEPGAGGQGELILLGTVRPGTEEEYTLKPSVVATLPVRFIAVSEMSAEPVESEWMWLTRGMTVELLATPGELISIDRPGNEPREHCPAAHYEDCPVI